MTSSTAPGRLGQRFTDLKDDPRVDPNLMKAMASLGLDTRQHEDLPELSRDKLWPMLARAHEGLDVLYGLEELGIPDAIDAEVTQQEETIKSFDGKDMKLWHFRRADLAGTIIPAVIYYHGGGMVIASTTAPLHFAWTRALALQGVHVVLVDFRNAWTAGADWPYPTGQLDCAAALKHVYPRKGELSISKIVLQGESGGANLALSTALRAKREGFLGHIDGVFACIPYIANGSLWSRERQLKELPSYVENEGYFLAQQSTAAMGWYYGPGHAEDSHAWPYYAAVEDLTGLPPHMIVVDELDMFRDEGIAYHRKLVKAGVQSTGRVNLGTVHGGEFIFRSAVPQMFNATIREIAAFAKSV